MKFSIEDFIAGWIGGVCNLFIGHPMDTIKVRQQYLGTNLVTTIGRTYRHEGIHGFYKGMLFPTLTIGPSNAIFFSIYSDSMKYLQQTSIRSRKISHSDSLAMRNTFIAGTFAGLFQVFFCCPVEMIKTVLQTRTEGLGSWKKHYEVPYSGSISAMKGILKDRGFKGFYCGLTPLIWRDVPTSGIYTLSYELCLHSYFVNLECSNYLKQIMAGGIAGVLSWIPVIPFDLVKSRMQTDDPQHPKYKNMSNCFISTYKEGGYKVFFKGTTMILARGFLTNGLIFVGYEAVMDLFNAIDL